MASQQVWCFLPTAALLFLLSVQTFAEVTESLSDCDSFLLDRTPPHVPGILEDGRILDQNRYKIICQTYMEQKRFMTLYDVHNRIPVFSAFKFTGEVFQGKPYNDWKIEPQLEDPNGDMNMVTGEVNRPYDHQAGDVDYTSSSIYDRGHIFPSFCASTKEDKESTFTLTNVVPQVKSFNQGSWNKMETSTKGNMKVKCINSNGDIEGFVVTGALPSSNNILNYRVNVPDALWSAFCCYNAKKRTWISSGYWGQNVPEEPRHKLETVTLKELQDWLRMSNFEFEIFPKSECYPKTAVRKVSPKSKKGLFSPTTPDSLPCQW